MRPVNLSLMDAPVIAAVKNDADLRQALESDCQVIFLLYGTVLNIDELVQRIHQLQAERAQAFRRLEE